MATTTRLVSTEDVIELALAQANFDAELLYDYVLIAQRHYLRDFLGDDFYNELLTQGEACTFTDDNTALMNDYIKPMLSQYVVYDALPQIRVNITNAGAMINSSQTSDAASSADFAQLRNNVLQLAQRWEKDTKKFIKDEQDDNSGKYPLYDGCDTDNHRGKNQIILY